MRYWPSSTPSDNAETTHHQARAGVPFAEFTRGYPVLGINFITQRSGLETNVFGEPIYRSLTTQSFAEAKP